jgi:serine kinase of HPr protein (carbohydrate metabolism regulator)
LASASNLVHATAIAVGNRGVLIRGPSGSGKSDLALRCLLSEPTHLLPLRATLVADDQVIVEQIGAGIRLSVPPPIAGRIEVRGLGLLRWPNSDHASLGLVVDLVARDRVERLPSATATTDVHGLAVSTITLHAFDASAHLKVLLAAHDLTRIGAA